MSVAGAGWLRERGEALARALVADLDDALGEVALALINPAAAARRVSPLHLALAVPGLCHDHVPDSRVRPGCAYCRRRGNAFAAR